MLNEEERAEIREKVEGMSVEELREKAEKFQQEDRRKKDKEVVRYSRRRHYVEAEKRGVDTSDKPKMSESIMKVENKPSTAWEEMNEARDEMYRREEEELEMLYALLDELEEGEE